MCAGDRSLSLIVLAVAAAMGLNLLVRRPTPPAEPPPPWTEALETRVATIAEAIATAEGYYARGEHDGHSLPYRLNNPGSLKKPALGADALPTWKDTGLVIFPTSEMGWAALRHQVRIMLTGASQVYHPSDTLHHVAAKYTDGDPNWGWTVAGILGVSPRVTLADLAASH